MVLLQQLKLSIEESHNANDGNAKGCGEKHFVEHLFLLVSGLGLGRIASFCSPCYKNEWNENRPSKGRRVKSTALQSFSAKKHLKTAGQKPRG